jgi:hypothetical protein
VRGSFAIAPNFQCNGTWIDRLLVAEGDGWRAPRETELAGLTLESPTEDAAACSCLFSIPAHLRSRFWAVLTEQAATGAGDFVAFANDVSQFLAFKGLPPPESAVLELLVQDVSGSVEAADLWALVNLGEEPVVLAWPDLRLRLSPGEGCRITASWPPDVVPPSEDPNVLLAIRSHSAGSMSASIGTMKDE